MKKLIKILFFSLLLIILISGAFLTGLYLRVSREASGRIEKGAIESVISSESPVYFDDGVSPIGVFFEKTHSKYIKYSDIPRSYIKAIIASEDHDYFSHPGFDIKAILRAFITNFRMGKVVQGGSTITQQTAKNIFKREKRTYLAKLRELMQAMILEKKYSKEEILEMYINQFFVTGFGKGLMIASEYFFDKDAKDLDLVESAFLAGMVKGPNMYNPFTKVTEEEKRKARNLAKLRKDYVLRNMRNLNLITEEQYVYARDREVPFKEGKITYALNVIMDYIREQLESDYFKAILREQGIDNIATSGIKIYTSINKEMQQGALDSIRRHLPLLDVKISGYQRDRGEERYIKNMGIIDMKPKPHLPFFCDIEEINRDVDNPFIDVSWDHGKGSIDYEGFRLVGEAWIKNKLGNPATFDRGHVIEFLNNFHKGDRIPVAFRGEAGKDGKNTLMLAEIPELEGSIVVLKNGMIKAMVGGFFDRYFNRATDAKRQLGSIFKPLVYTAALQLNWNYLDPLMNMTDLFEFENTFYVPKPDHEPNSNKVSMLWAGVKSENLATVWLLYHLTDRLNMSEFRTVAEKLDLARNKDEPYYTYVERIRDKYGVVVDRDAILEAAFEMAKKDIAPDLIFDDREDVLENLYRLHYDIDRKSLMLEKDNDYRIWQLSYERLKFLNHNMKKEFKEIEHLMKLRQDANDPAIEEKLKTLMQNFHYEKMRGFKRRIVYSGDADAQDLQDLKIDLSEWMAGDFSSVSPNDIWIGNMIPSGVMDMLQESMNKRYSELSAYKRYDLEVLSEVRDFKVLVNLYYICRLARELGITTQLDPVMSFPLGANSISIMEAAIAYHTMIDGRRYGIGGHESPYMTPIITKITDRDDKLIWEYKPRPKVELSETVTGSIREILRKVMEYGTGRNAKDSVQLSVEFAHSHFQIPIPSFGKTGTSNRYTNSSFVGFIPGLDRKTGAFDMNDGYVVASYVGFDDNRPMRGKFVSIYGASGALPLWIDASNAIANCSEYRNGLQTVDLAFGIQPDPAANGKDLVQVTLSPVTGLPSDDTAEGISVKVQKASGNDVMLGKIPIQKRVFEPLTGVNNDIRK